VESGNDDVSELVVGVAVADDEPVVGWCWWWGAAPTYSCDEEEKFARSELISSTFDFAKIGRRTTVCPEDIMFLQIK